MCYFNLCLFPMFYSAESGFIIRKCKPQDCCHILFPVLQAYHVSKFPVYLTLVIIFNFNVQFSHQSANACIISHSSCMDNGYTTKRASHEYCIPICLLFLFHNLLKSNMFHYYIGIYFPSTHLCSKYECCEDFIGSIS